MNTKQKIVSILGEDNIWKQIQALEELKLDRYELFSILREALNGSLPEIRVNVIRLMGRLNFQVATPYLIALLTDSNHNIRARVAKELGFLKANSAHSALIQRVVMDPDLRVRINAIWALGYMGASKALPCLIATLSDNEPQLVIQACQALGAIKDRKAIRPLVRLLDQTKHNQVLTHAIEALGMFSGMDINILLIRMLSDPREIVRSFALMSLGKKKEGGLQFYFEVMGRDQEQEVRRSSFWALGQLENHSAKEVLRQSASQVCFNYLNTINQIYETYHPRSPYF